MVSITSEGAVPSHAKLSPNGRYPVYAAPLTMSIDKNTRKPVAAASPMPRKIDSATPTLITPNDHSFSISTHNDGHRIEGCVDAKHWAVFYSIILPKVRSIIMDTF